MNLYLIGFKNVGKTTLGKKLAKQIGVPFWDSDQALLKKFFPHYPHKTISDLYREKGEEGFRIAEEDLLMHLDVKKSVVALGGGSIESKKIQKKIKTLGHIIYLKESLEALKKRMLENPIPAFLSLKDFDLAFDQLYEARVKLYEKCADTVIDLSSQTEEQILECLSTLAHKHFNFT